MSDRRYQFSPWHIRAWRQVRYSPWWFLQFCWWMFRWLVTRCPATGSYIPYTEGGRWKVPASLWFSSRVMVAIDMWHTWYIDELIEQAKAKQGDPRAWPKGWPWYKQACFYSWDKRCDMLIGPCSCGAWHKHGEFEWNADLKILYRYGRPVDFLLNGVHHGYDQDHRGYGVVSPDGD